MRIVLMYLCVFLTIYNPNSAQTSVMDTCMMCQSPSVRRLMFRAQSVLTNASDLSKDTGKMVLIPSGNFLMGSEDSRFYDAKPIHRVELDSFLMDAHEVTNAQFAQFVASTGYITIAERPLDPKEFPEVDIALLKPGSAVFSPPDHAVSLNNPMNWWQYVIGANWRHPFGPNSSIEGKNNEPVTQICYWDAKAYADWAGKELPTEAEWEYAARAGLHNSKYYWGDTLTPNGAWMANIFQGEFPYHNTLDDHYQGVAPVESFPPNKFGLYDMDGNVWEWCSDYYRSDYYSNSPRSNPQGPNDSYDPEEPGLKKRVQKGGSFLCSDQYCIRYLAGSRGKGEESSASNNLGFRCVVRIKKSNK